MTLAPTEGGLPQDPELEMRCLGAVVLAGSADLALAKARLAELAENLVESWDTKLLLAVVRDEVTAGRPIDGKSLARACAGSPDPLIQGLENNARHAAEHAVEDAEWPGAVARLGDLAAKREQALARDAELTKRQGPVRRKAEPVAAQPSKAELPRVEAVALRQDTANPEARALGALLLGADEADERTRARIESLEPHDFGDRRCRAIVGALKAVQAAGGLVDSVSLDAKLRESGGVGLAVANWVPSLLGLVPTSGAFEGLLAEVRAESQKRRVLADIDDLRAMVAGGRLTPSQAADLLEDAGRTARAHAVAETAPPWRSLAELRSLDLPTPSPLVEGLLRRGEVAVLGGASKSFKSWVALDLALAVACGRKWLGRECERGRAVFVNLELPEWAARNRLNSIASARADTPPADSPLVWTLRGQRPTAERIRDTLVKWGGGLSLVVIDPVYMLLAGRDENAASDIGDLLAGFGALARDTGAAVLLTAHFAKGDASAKSSQDRVSGSGVFARYPDTLLTLTRHEEEDCFSFEATLRTFAPLPPAVVRWQHPVFTVDSGLDPARLKQSGGRPSKYDPEKVADLLRRKPLTELEWRDAAMGAFEMPRKSFCDYKERLVAKGRVIENPQAGTYYLPRKGGKP